MVGQGVELVAHEDTTGQMLDYERLLGNALEGRNDLFALREGVEAEWSVVDDIVAARTPLHVYEPGTWGPDEAEGIIAGSGPWHAPRGADDGKNAP